MHNRIYQIWSEPVPEEDYITEFDYLDDWFTREVADSVDGGLNREEEIQALGKHLENTLHASFDYENASFTIPEGGKELYFAEAYKTFTAKLEKLKAVNFTAFVQNDGVGGLVADLKDSFCEKFGDYVSDDGSETVPIDEFVRYMNTGERYYIGEILDYHW